MLKYLLKASKQDFIGNWGDYFPLIEFAYNNIYDSSIKMVLFEALYGRRYMSPIGQYEVGERALIGLSLVFDFMDSMRIIEKKLKLPNSLKIIFWCWEK